MTLTLSEARARADQLSEVAYDVAVDLRRPAGGTFGSRTTVRFRSAAPQTFLELSGAADLRVTVNGAAATPAYDGERITLTGLATGAENAVTVEARLPFVTDGAGMHHHVDPADGETYVSAYLGNDLARKVFACFDQLDLKAPLTVRVEADPAWTVLANGRAESRPDDGRWTFTTTPPVPPGLFVLCAGPWHSVRWEHAGLPFGWHARRSLAAALDRDAGELRAATVACFDHYTAMFDEPYPFDSYDQVFVPGLNWGAQEMPGCVTYRDELLPAGHPSDPERVLRGTIVAHEMAHMWFGDLVTMRWWEDSWLNESFADYMGVRVGEEAAGFAGALVMQEAVRTPQAYVADARRSTHPVAPEAEEIPDSDVALTIFDAISYAKGNAVLRQLVAWLGDEEFLAGVNAHLTTHRFGNASLADLVGALDAASERDVAGWAEVWLRRSGFDTVRVERDGDVPVLVRDGVRPHRLRVTTYDDALAEVDSRLVDLADEPVRLEGAAGLVVVPNAGGETFARLALDDRSWQAVAAGLSAVEDDVARAVLWTTAFGMVHEGQLSPREHLDLVVRHVPRERHVVLLSAVLDHATARLLPLRVTAAEAADAVDAVAEACATGLAADGVGEAAAVVLTRTLAATSRDSDLLQAWLADRRTGDGVEVDLRLRWAVLHRLAALGVLDAGAIEAERRREPSATSELGALTALAARPTAEAKAEAWAAMGGADVSNREYQHLAAGLWSPEQATLVAPYVSAYLAEAPAAARRRGPAFADVVGGCFPALALTTTQVGELEAALAGDVPAVLRRAWEDRLDDLRAPGGDGAGHRIG